MSTVLALTGLAQPLICSRDLVGVRLVEQMPLRAMAPPSEVPNDAALYVFPSGDDFHVIGVDAVTSPTEMIHDEPLRNRPNACFIDPSVRHMPSAIDSKLAVAMGVQSQALPQPASFSFTNVFKKSFNRPLVHGGLAKSNWDESKALSVPGVGY